MSCHFISTAIPYVNAKPHLGFAFELVLADAIARSRRARGEDVRFVTGTDDNSLKNVRAAETASLETRAFVDRNAAHFARLATDLGVSFDDFVRTSDDARHRATVAALWEACVRRGDIYRRAYRGLYCVGCEQFYDPEELAPGEAPPRCPEHERELELVDEENYFFRLSKYREPIARLLASSELVIEPKERKNEVLAVLERGLHDVSVSRSRARARGWGIEVPGDPSQVIYVWLDALAYYVSAQAGATHEERAERWSEASCRVHVVGQGITRFHAILWPAILLSAGLPPPTRLLVHGYVTVDGRKIGKSSGATAVDPEALVRSYGEDAVRYFLLRHVSAAKGGDFSIERFAKVYKSELADQLGNLVARTLALVERGGVDLRGAVVTEGPLAPLVTQLAARVDAAVDRFAIDDALRSVFGVVDAANKYLTDAAPWTLLARARATDDACARDDAARVLRDVSAAIASVARCLAPFLPKTAAAIELQLAGALDRRRVLFPRIDVAAPAA